MLDGLKQKIRGLRIVKTNDEKLLDDLVALNRDLIDEEGGEIVSINRNQAIARMREIRSTLSVYGLEGPLGDTVAAASAYDIERVRSAAETEYKKQMRLYGTSVQQRILAAMRLAEDTLDLEGDLFSAIVSPIELSLTSRVWVTARDQALMKEINDLLRAWNVAKTICDAWQDMETYSAFYVSHAWKDEFPTPIHWSPKRVAVGNVGGFYGQLFDYLPPNKTKVTGDEAQTALEFFEAVTGKEWNDWPQDASGGARLIPEYLSWEHFLKPRHKVYPYPWVAKGATPAYTRQIIEEMRLALVQGVMNQLWVMTIEEPQSREISKLKSVISSNRAERIGFLIWRAGLKVDVYSPNAIEQLLLPDAWWAATLDMFRRIGRPIRIVAGENPQRSGQSSNDAEIDTRILQNKAMGHRQVVAERIVLDLIRQWGNLTKNKAALDAVNKGQIMVHMTPIQLFLGEDLTKIWGPMWDRGMTSIRTIHAALGIDTDFEAEMLKLEEQEGFEDVFIARQQFAQRVATPKGEVTRSPSGGRPPGEEVKAAMEDISPRILAAFDEIDKAKEPEDRKRKVTAFIALLTALIGAHMRSAYREGYAAAHGWQTVSEDKVKEAILWEQGYIDNFEAALLEHVELGESVAGERYRAELHPKSSWKRAYMDGVFQAKEEAGWRYWQRVLRPEASKTGPCEVCIADSKVWHPISEPFWDHPYGVCSLQMVRFMRTGLDGWESISSENVAVPLVY